MSNGVVTRTEPSARLALDHLLTVLGASAVVDDAGAVTLTCGSRRVVLRPAGAGALEAPSAEDPLVADRRVGATGCGPLAGLHLWLTDVAPVAGPGVPVLVGDTGVTLAVTDGEVTTVGTTCLADDAHLADTAVAEALVVLLTGRRDGSLARSLGALHGPTSRPHRDVPVVVTHPEAMDLSLLPPGATACDDEALVRAAARSARLLPAEVHDALVDFQDDPDPSGALLIRGLPVGTVPPTPAAPGGHGGKDLVSEFVLLTVARRLGQPVGYEPELGGKLVQDLSPVAGTSGRQVSTSSDVLLQWHTETAFHPHKPRYLLLLCLRGDPQARTLLASVRELVGRLPLRLRRVLHEPRFRTGLDESFARGRSSALGRPMPVLTGPWEAPFLTFDADLMVGVDAESQDALDALREGIEACHTGVALAAGDLLVVDNHLAVHGRSPFRARFDGTDRWLQRAFVVSELSASAADRRGRIVTTRFVA